MRLLHTSFSSFLFFLIQTLHAFRYFSFNSGSELRSAEHACIFHAAIVVLFDCIPFLSRFRIHSWMQRVQYLHATAFLMHKSMLPTCSAHANDVMIPSLVVATLYYCSFSCLYVDKN